MPNPFKISLIEQLTSKYGKPKQLPGSLSLFEIAGGLARIYVRYSKVHPKNRTSVSFYGLRKDDLKQLEGYNSFICFLWNTQTEPMVIPFSDFEDVFHSIPHASDGQFKVQIFHGDQIELYIANAGRFNIEGFLGWHVLDDLIDKSNIPVLPDFSHSQVQTLIGSIGIAKGYDIWIPPNDRNRLDWHLTDLYSCTASLPSRYEKIVGIVGEVDVVWVERGASGLRALFEVEHSTPIYSGLLRFNDLHLTEPDLKPRFSIVSNDMRRSAFLRQLNRPTFRISGLIDLCNFLEYKDVYNWFNRIRRTAK
jgi:hypothetical protein